LEVRTLSTTVATVSQLVNCEAVDAFDAFADPDKITQFWLSSTSGRLTEGAKVTWHFMVPGVTDTLTIDVCRRPSLIQLTWSDGSKTRLEFSGHAQGQTKVSVSAEVQEGTDHMDQVVNTTEGFSIVLCDLKTLLESGRSANLVRAKAELIAASMAAQKRDA
jgi:uncharacterized protein YndB with AHSA1/START domain